MYVRCSQVTKGGIAETLGMCVGDIVVRVNDTPTSNLNHSLAQEVILGCGNSFVMGLLRPDEDGSNLPIARRRSSALVNDEFERISADCQQPTTATPDSLAYSDMSEITIDTLASEESAGTSPQLDLVEELKQRQRQQHLQQQLQRIRAAKDLEPRAMDDHIAELLAVEAEVLKEHNVIGYVLDLRYNKGGRTQLIRCRKCSASTFRKSYRRRACSRAVRCSST